jgi:hypothetical protein
MVNPSGLVLPAASLPANTYIRLSQVEDNATLNAQLAAARQPPYDDGGLDWSHPVWSAPDSFARVGGYLETGMWSSSISPTELHFSYLASIFPDAAHAVAFYQNALTFPPNTYTDLSAQFSTIGDQRSALVLHMAQGIPATIAAVFFTRYNVELEIQIVTSTNLSPTDTASVVAILHSMATVADGLVMDQLGTPTPTATPVPTSTPVPKVKTCKKGYKRVHGRCQRVQQHHRCKKGYKFVHGKCRRIKKRH